MAISSAQPPSLYQIRDVQINIAARSVSRGGDVLHVNGLTFDFLLALIQSAPNIASYDELTDRVWKGRPTSPEVIAQRASMLRRALGSDGGEEEPYFEAVRGRGFRLLGAVVTHSDEHLATGTSGNFRSIAVLPFAILSADPHLDYFGDGLVEDIISELSHIPQLLVISRLSTFTYRNSTARARKIAKRLGVECLLRGSVRHSGGKLRITAQLVDAKSEATFWSKKYDCDLSNAFQVQDYLTDQIVTALDVELVSGEQGRQQRIRYSSAEAGELIYRGMYEHNKFEPSAGLVARRNFEEFVQLEPDSVIGYRWLSSHWAFALIVGWEIPEIALKNLKICGDKALSIDSHDPIALVSSSYFLSVSGDLEGALDVLERAMEAAPSNDEAWFLHGYCLNMLGRTDEAIASLRHAMRLCPILPAVRYGVLGTAYRNAGRYTEAIRTFEQCLEENRDFLFAHASLAVIHSMAGDLQRARQEVQYVLKMDPEFTITRFVTPDYYRDKSVMADCAEALRRVGLPE